MSGGKVVDEVRKELKREVVFDFSDDFKSRFSMLNDAEQKAINLLLNYLYNKLNFDISRENLNMYYWYFSVVVGDVMEKHGIDEDDLDELGYFLDHIIMSEIIKEVNKMSGVDKFVLSEALKVVGKDFVRDTIEWENKRHKYFEKMKKYREAILKTNWKHLAGRVQIVEEYLHNVLPFVKEVSSVLSKHPRISQYSIPISSEPIELITKDVYTVVLEISEADEYLHDFDEVFRSIYSNLENMAYFIFLTSKLRLKYYYRQHKIKFWLSSRNYIKIDKRKFSDNFPVLRNAIIYIDHIDYYCS